jgi:hypothetical protein
MPYVVEMSGTTFSQANHRGEQTRVRCYARFLDSLEHDALVEDHFRYYLEYDIPEVRRLHPDHFSAPRTTLPERCCSTSISGLVDCISMIRAPRIGLMRSAFHRDYLKCTQTHMTCGSSLTKTLNQTMEVIASGRYILLSGGLNLYPAAMRPLARETSSRSR